MTKIQITPKWSDVKPSDCYVYIHRRASDGVCFYVGRGVYKRGWDSSITARNPWWINIAEKHGVEVEIAQCGLSNDDANLLEMWLIAKFRHEGIFLCNMTDGGEGVTGRKMSAASRKKIADKATGRVHSEETREKLCRAWVGRVISDDTRERMSRAHKGKVKSPEHQRKITESLKGRKMPDGFGETISKTQRGKSGRLSRSHDRSIYRFSHESGDVFLGMRVDFKEYCGIDDPSMSNLISGKTVVSKGWRVEIVEDLRKRRTRK